MLSETALNEAQKELASVKEKINSLKARKTELEALIRENSRQVVQSQFPEIEPGDKVRLTYKVYQGLGIVERTDTLYYNGVVWGKYEWENTPDAMRLSFSPLKKDGTRDCRVNMKSEISDSRIIKIEKI